jgi:hypothetical protein
MKYRGVVLKVCSVAAVVLLAVVALGPAKWQPRTGLGWQVEHFVGYFGFTLMFCLVWGRPIVVGGGSSRCFWRGCKL